MGPLAWGTWGPYFGIPTVEYFPNVFFWASWAPWASPKCSGDPPKNLIIFQGAVWLSWLKWMAQTHAKIKWSLNQGEMADFFVHEKSMMVVIK